MQFAYGRTLSVPRLTCFIQISNISENTGRTKYCAALFS